MSKRVTWRTSIVSKSGLALQNYLNDMNFQPGKFIVLDAPEVVLDSYKVVYVESEEEESRDE